jgi:hypothetical protein
MAVHGAARTRAAQRLEREARQATRLLLGELTTTHLALIVEGNRRAGVDAPARLPLDAYLPAGRQAERLLTAYQRRIAQLEGSGR